MRTIASNDADVSLRPEADLIETLKIVADEIRSAHPHRAIHLELDFMQPAVIDRPRIAQLFSNLVSNAVTHGLEDHPVRITGRHGPDGLEVSVHNAGPAIPKDDVQKLFMPFMRGAASRGGQGLGLGLYIALEIAKAPWRNTDVSSNETGTCFTFRMPPAS